MTFTTFFPPIILQYKSIIGLGKILCSKNLHVYGTYMYSRSILARLMLDRRRLEDAHFQYAILKVALWYPSSFKLTDLPLHGPTRETLLHMSDLYYGAFMKKYSGNNII